MTDSAFVGMVVHVALAVQRLKAGEGIEIAESILAELKQCSEFQWAKEVAGQLSTALEVTIPESEMGYITMHLLGSHTGRNYHQIYEYPTEEFARDMIIIAGNRLNVSLVEDQDLFSHLTQHLVSALYRISMNMKIRNPLLSEVRINYPAEYAAACEAVDYLEKRTALSIPDEETGYLAMHFGAAVLRKERAVTRKYRVIVVCTSGIGTSRLLAAKIKKELPNLEVAAVVPLLGLEEFAGWESIDLVIATMNVDIEHTPVVEVSPFLTKEDCLKIETRLAAVGTKPSHAEEIISVEQMIRKMNTYGQAVSDILAHVQLIHGLSCKSKEEVIREAAYGALLQDPAADVETIMHDLLEREKMGIWMAKSVGLSLIHYRTKGIHKPVVSIYRLSEPVEWQDHETVHSVLVMLVPEQAPQEYLDMIGGISEAMIEEEVLKRLADGSEAEMKVLIQQILSSAYTAKAKQLIGAST